jgi:hypothetical protein
LPAGRESGGLADSGEPADSTASSLKLITEALGAGSSTRSGLGGAPTFAGEPLALMVASGRELLVENKTNTKIATSGTSASGTNHQRNGAIMVGPIDVRSRASNAEPV